MVYEAAKCIAIVIFIGHSFICRYLSKYYSHSKINLPKVNNTVAIAPKVDDAQRVTVLVELPRYTRHQTRLPGPDRTVTSAPT